MNQIKKFRQQHSLTQKQAATTLGYNLRTWQEYEQGRKQIPQHLIKHIKLYNLHFSN